jgi:hypothetical protein
MFASANRASFKSIISSIKRTHASAVMGRNYSKCRTINVTEKSPSNAALKRQAKKTKPDSNQVKVILSPSLRVTIAFFQLEDWPA